MFAAITDVLWTVATIGVLLGLMWLSRRIDPHWVAKDGRAFTCRVQPVHLPSTGSAGLGGGRRSLGESRWRNARGVVRDNQVILVARGISADPRLRIPQAHPVIGRGTNPPKRSISFLLGGEPNYLLIIPTSSKAIAVIDSLVGARHGGQGSGEVGE